MPRAVISALAGKLVEALKSGAVRVSPGVKSWKQARKHEDPSRIPPRLDRHVTRQDGFLYG
jgi:hypothetical protein